MVVSNSQIQCYKNCRRLYQLQYHFGIKAITKSEALERGSSYHDKLEQLFNTGDFELDDNIKANAMAIAFKKYIYPKLSPVEAEKWFKYNTEMFGHEVIGRLDAVNSDGLPIEHKTTSEAIDDAYWFGLQNNEQILTYMLAMGVNEMYYTACMTPNIRQKKDESDEDFQQRCVDWYDVDTDTKIGMNKIYRTEEELKKFAIEQSLTIEEMHNCELFFRNESYCKKWGRMCEYSPICSHYNPNEVYVGFERKELRTDETESAF